MFNLLPENLRVNIKKEYFVRKVVLSLVFVIFLQTVFLIFIFPSWLISSYKEKEVVSRGEEMNKYLSSLNVASTTSNIRMINQKLAVIDGALSYPEMVPIIKNILSKRTSAIKIVDVVYISDGEKSASVSIKGKSETRESLLSFVKSLQDTNLFKSVDLPISNLTKDKNLSFSIEIKIDRQ